VHQSRVRIGENKRSAMAYGFKHSDEVILVEDDVLVPYDLLEYFGEMFFAFKHSDIFHIEAFSILHSSNINEACLKTIYKTGFPVLCGCWGIWRRSWDKLIHSGWNGKDQHFLNIYNKFKSEYSIRPKVPRMMNIGKISSNGRVYERHDNLTQTKYWSNDFDIPNNIDWKVDD
jgi:hypothetical protein